MPTQFGVDGTDCEQAACHRWRLAAERRMSAFGVVIAGPGGDLPACVGEPEEQALVQHFVAQPAGPMAFCAWLPLPRDGGHQAASAASPQPG